MSPEDSQQLDDAMNLTKLVRAAIEGAGLQIDSLTVAAAPNGDVSLFGFAKSDDDPQRAIELAQSVEAVNQVASGILVLGS